MFCKLLKSHRNILSKSLLNDIVRKKSILQTLTLTAGKGPELYQAENVESPLKGKNVVFIGGYGGIGLAACKEMASKGIKNLTIMGRQNYLHMLEDLQSSNKDLVVHFVNLNSKKGNDAIEAALNLSLEYMGHIDVLVNSSTITSERKSIPQVDSDLVLNYPKNLSSLDDFKKNLHRLHENIVDTTNSAILLMSQEHGGHGGLIVNISSVFGLEPSTYSLVYAAIKQDIIDTTRVFAQKYNEKTTGITHMGICPGEYITYVLSRFTPENLKAIAPTNQRYATRSDTQCVKAIIEAIESGRNGSVWISDLGKLLEIKLNLVDNLGVAFINRLKTTLSKNDAIVGPNLYTFTDAPSSVPASQTSARNFSTNDEGMHRVEELSSEYDSPYAESDVNTWCSIENPTSTDTYKSYTTFLSWDKLTAIREKAKAAIYKKFFTYEITANPAICSENPAIVGSYTGPAITSKTTSNGLLPSTPVRKNSIRNFSANDDDKTGECDSPYAECESVPPLRRSKIPTDGTTKLSWNKIAEMREKSKLSTHKQYFTKQNDINDNPPFGSENPAFVLSYNGPNERSKSIKNIKKMIETTNEEEKPPNAPDEIMKLINARNEIIKQREEIPLIVGNKTQMNATADELKKIINTRNEIIKKRRDIPLNADGEIKQDDIALIADDEIEMNTADDQKANAQGKKIRPNELSRAFEYYTNSNAAPQKKQQNEVTPTMLSIKTLPVAAKINATSPLKGKNVALFGGFYGIPLATCREMAKKGIKNLVILGGNLSTEQELKSTNPDLNVNFIPIRRRRNGRTGIDYALNKTIERMGHIDILVHGNKIRNCYCPKMAISNCLRCVIDTEFCAIPFMSREYGHKGGSIINLSSIVCLEPLAFPTIHKAIKRGIINFTRTFAHQNFNEKTGITHMAICPGENIMTAFGKYIDESKNKDLFKAKTETACVCSKAIVTAIEKAENGIVWIIDLDKEKKLKLRKISDSTA